MRIHPDGGTCAPEGTHEGQPRRRIGVEDGDASGKGHRISSARRSGSVVSSDRIAICATDVRQLRVPSIANRGKTAPSSRSRRV